MRLVQSAIGSLLEQSFVTTGMVKGPEVLINTGRYSAHLMAAFSCLRNVSLFQYGIEPVTGHFLSLLLLFCSQSEKSHTVVYLPKFHCELNGIERLWANNK